MLWAIIIPAFMLGLVSSAHCIGMCGPLALALPLQHFSGSTRRFIGVLLYNSGRITSYLLLGILFGWLGRNLLVPGVQQWIAIIAGAVMIIISLLSVTKGAHYRVPYLQKIFKPVYLLLNYCMKQKQLPGIYLLGIANGLLPCGLVYIAATGAFMWGDTAKGLVFMAFYGLGTVPAMAGLSLLGYAVSLPVRNIIRRAAPCIALFAGVLLLLRGLNLNIPFIASWPIPGLNHDGLPCGPLK